MFRVYYKNRKQKMVIRPLTMIISNTRETLLPGIKNRTDKNVSSKQTFQEVTK